MRRIAVTDVEEGNPQQAWRTSMLAPLAIERRCRGNGFLRLIGITICLHVHAFPFDLESRLPDRSLLFPCIEV